MIVLPIRDPGGINIDGILARFASHSMLNPHVSSTAWVIFSYNLS